MGWQSTVVFMNDFIHRMKEDKEAGLKIYNAIGELNNRRSPYGGRFQYGRAVEQHHADGHILLSVGDYNGKVLGAIKPIKNVEDDKEVVEAMRFFLKQRGYMVSKWSKRRK